MKEETLRLGQKVKTYLKEKGITQRHLAAISGIEEKRLSFLLNSKAIMWAEENFKICEALDVPYDFFKNYESEEIKKSS